MARSALWRGSLIPVLASVACTTTLPRNARQIDSGMSVCAATSPARSEQQVPVNRAALERLIDEVFDRGQRDAAGVAVIVMHEGRVVVQRQFGLASIEHRIPFTPNHVVRLPYSEGREFLAITAALMAQDGLIRLEDPVRRWFPRLPEWSAPVTIRDLLEHRSGFVDEWSTLLLMHASMGNRLDESQFLRLLYNQPAPEIEPTKGYMYSNSDYGLLRMILQQVASGDLAGYMKQRIFEPLGMHATRLDDDPTAVVANRAPFYANDGDGYKHSIEVKTSPGGHYVIATSACDLARWSEAHSIPSSEISRATARLVDGAVTLPALENHFAFGHSVANRNGTRVIRHEGVLGANYLTRIPAAGYSVVTFGNRYYEPAENAAIVKFLLGQTVGEPTRRIPTERVNVATEALSRYAGQYVSTDIPSWESKTLVRRLVEISASVAGLEARVAGDRLKLVPVGGSTFSWNGDWGMLFQFDTTRAGREPTLRIEYDDGAPAETYIRYARWTPSPELLQRVIGTYHSAHLDYTWKLMLDESGSLVVRAPTIGDIRLEPHQESEFQVMHEKYPGIPARYWVRFHMNATGAVTHLTVSSPRLMHHRFDRR